jgi:DNA polymerase I-like protein with 3'-5' exonuclease and polymerase domains
MTKLALAKIRDYIIDNQLEEKVKLIHVVHDATYCEVRADFAEEFSKIQSKLMIEAGEDFKLALPMLTDICISTCWTK